MSEPTAKQQIVDKLKEVDNVLVTVSSSPTVDELSAALGFTLLVNKLNKHATAVFSGAIPPAITFLDPEKTFENTVDSLRDFIIALDKEKADHLRYKVEGDMVKIFITPYRTTIDDSDFEFSQGDYNVEMVVAIGVKNTDDLDRALADHGRILHDATVASLSMGEDYSDLGTLNWHDKEASSYSEMLVSLSEALRNDKNLIDEQIATAFLTGIVAATDRFSNERTTSKSMTMAAQLMAAGANQQLIATRLEEVNEVSSQDNTNNDGTTDLADDVSTKVKKEEVKEEVVEDRQAADGTMKISHEKKGDVDEVAAQLAKEKQAEAAKHAEEMLAESLAATTPAASALPTVNDLKADIEQAAAELRSDEPSLPSPEPTIENHPQIELDAKPTDPDMPQFEPTFGGTLNATSEQAAEDKRREEMSDKNKKILSHGNSTYVEGPPSGYPAVNSFNQPVSMTESQTSSPLEDPHVDAPVSTHGNDLQPLSNFGQEPAPVAPPLPPQENPPFQTLEDIDREHRTTPPELPDADAAIADALQNAPSMSEQQNHIPSMPVPDPNTPPLPPMPDFSTLPPLPPAPGVPVEPVPSPEQAQKELQNNLPTVSPINAAPGQPPAPTDPGQFRIPGQ